jgi:hypothetical protein
LTVDSAGCHPLYAVFTGSETGTVGGEDLSTGACCDSVFAAARAFRALGAGA